MRILLDTSAYSSFMRRHQGVKEAIRSAARFLSIRSSWVNCRPGFSMVGTPIRTEKTLKQFLASPRVRVMAMDEETTGRYAVILNALWTVGRPIPTNDRWIAASAMQYGLTILTTDAHFKHVAQVLVHHVALT